MTQTASSGSQRHALYVLAGAVAGIVIMVVPGLVLAPYSWVLVLEAGPRQSFELKGPLAAYALASPLDAIIEVLWLIVPALVVIFAVYWLAVHRTRSAGQGKATKRSRR